MVESKGEIIEEFKQPRLLPNSQKRRTASFGNKECAIVEDESFHSSASELD